MKLPISVRKIHYWLSLLVAVPALVIFPTGLLLQIKKHVPWIQPSERRGPAGPPAILFHEILASCRRVPELGVNSWADIDRIDVRPDRGMLKVICRNRWEAQLDATTGEMLQTAYRRSDLIEKLHDGSYFGTWVKRGIFWPTALLLLAMWATGVYLFILPMVRKRASARRVVSGASLLRVEGNDGMKP